MVERLSKLGEHGAVWYAIGLTGAVLDEPRRDLWLAGARRVGIAYVANQVLKVLVRRERPVERAVHTHSNLSFPSAHTTTSFCGARMYGRLAPPLPLYALAAAIAASRLALRVHHPSDVVAGAALGTVIAR